MKKYLVAILTALLLVGGFHLYVAKPEVYLRSFSPDGKWRISMQRNRVIPYIQGVRVVAILEGAEGVRTEVELAGMMDSWSDPVVYFGDVRWTSDAVEIHPGRLRTGSPVSIKKPANP